MVERFGGQIPTEAASFRSLPGVGPYTCGAVMSIAFGQPEPAVDGNVQRVMARYLGLRDPVHSPALQSRAAGAVRAMMREQSPGDVTQGLMELGATVCVPRAPACSACPLAGGCVARSAGLVSELPVRREKRPRRVVDVVALWWQVDDLLLMQRRSAGRLLNGLWQLPAVELSREGAEPTEEEAAHLLQEAFGWLWGDAAPPAAGAREAVAEEAAAHAEAEKAVAGEAVFANKVLVVKESATAVPERGAGRAFALVAREAHAFTHLEWQVRVYRPLGHRVATLPRVTTQLGTDEQPGTAGQAVAALAAAGERVECGPGELAFVRIADLSRLPLPRVYDRLFSTLLGSWYNDGEEVL
ncbi:MAG: hypothetical protein K6T30_01245 [Alicyclobacillus sp.]|nr:hypothetical protein [Alicyclobacillus sp.]